MVFGEMYTEGTFFYRVLVSQHRKRCRQYTYSRDCNHDDRFDHHRTYTCVTKLHYKKSVLVWFGNNQSVTIFYGRFLSSDIDVDYVRTCRPPIR
jgi:hypothetical protein